MCGRFTITEIENFHTRYGITSFEVDIDRSYNVSPGQFAYIITNEDKKYQVEKMKWGLIPFWAKDPKIGYKMINARAESVSEKPSFRNSFKSKRCLVPASGFYEWQKQEDRKQPFYIRLKNKSLFSFAGLYDEWKDFEDRIIKTFTIITTVPNKILSEIHNRMPVILGKDEEKKWLDQDSKKKDLVSMLNPFESSQMDLYPVSDLVNNPKNNSTRLIRPLS